MLTQAPHRSGRARLTHPAPRERGFATVGRKHACARLLLYPLSVPIALRPVSSSSSQRSSLETVPRLDVPFPPRGPGRAGSPASRGTTGRSALCLPSHFTSGFPLVPRYHECIPCASCRPGMRGAAAALLVRGAPVRFRGVGRASQVPGEPQCVRAPLFDPGGTPAPGHLRRLRAALVP